MLACDSVYMFVCVCQQLLYGSLVITEADARYVSALTKEVLEAVYREAASDIPLGTEIIPVPPADLCKHCII
jgi:hypothetical protein